MPLAEHDCIASRSMTGPSVVSIHVPLAEHDHFRDARGLVGRGFNSRAPRGARHEWAEDTASEEAVSIHVPLAEHDRMSDDDLRDVQSFQFTCPSRSTTR